MSGGRVQVRLPQNIPTGMFIDTEELITFAGTHIQRQPKGKRQPALHTPQEKKRKEPAGHSTAEHEP